MTKGINWQDIEYKLLRQFEWTAHYFYINKTPYYPEYHTTYMAQQLLAELKGWA